MKHRSQITRKQPAVKKKTAAAQRAGRLPQIDAKHHLEQEARHEGAALVNAARNKGGALDVLSAFADIKEAAQQRYERDLSEISLDDSPDADIAAQHLAASGFTIGNTIYLRHDKTQSSSPPINTVAHEMVHAVQQTGGATAAHMVSTSATAVARREQTMGEQLYSVKLNRLNYLLSYRFLDWAITDEEAVEALSLLESMNSTERASALGSIRYDRLHDNLPLESQREQLDIMLKQTEGMRTDVRDINTLLDTHVFDWTVTDSEAIAALQKLEALPVPARHYAVMGINRRVLTENLPDAEKMRFYILYDEAQEWWNRQRQQRDPLNAGDVVRIRVYNPVAGDFEDKYFPPDHSYRVDPDLSLTLPLIGSINIAGQRPLDIQRRIERALFTGKLLHKSAVSVEVIKRGTETFSGRTFPFEKDQPDDPLQPGDTFQLMVVESLTHQEEADFRKGYLIDHGGSVDLPYIGRIVAAGLTRSQLTLEIAKHLKGWYKSPPTVWVWVLSHGHKSFTLPGKFDRPHVSSRHSIAESEAKRKPLILPRRLPVDIYLEFYRTKAAKLAKGTMSARDKRLEQEALFRFMEWLSRNSTDEAVLNATNPWKVYGNIYTPLLFSDIKRSSREKVFAEKEKRWKKENDAAVKAKLDEHWAWAMRMWKEAGKKFSSAGPAHLITEHPYRKIGMNALTDAVLSWAFANTDHPRFKEMSSLEIADMLMKENPTLKIVFDIGMKARPRHEYFPELDRARQTLGETALEVLIGFIPFLGEAQDFSDLATGVSLTGHKLDATDRMLAGVGLLIPFVGGRALRGGGELAGSVLELSRKTGRSIDEIEDIFRVAGNLTPDDARHIERIMETVADKKALSNADLDILDNIAKKLKGPLEELAEARKAGGKLPVKPLRVDPVTATTLVPGTSAHMSQRWLEYQVRNPDMFPRLTGVIDPKWERLYNTIIANKRAGGKFEGEVIDFLASSHHPGLLKNNQMMIPDGSSVKGFIPDGVKGNPSELVWGQPYHLLEVKGWKAMSHTGNLRAMIEYVDRFGGHIEVVFRSAKHADSATTLSGPLNKILNNLVAQGKATIRRFP